MRTWTPDQALAAGFTPAGVKRRLRNRMWRVIYPRIYAAATTPATRAMAASAARLRVGDGAMFSQFTAARLLDMDVRHDDQDVWLRAPLDSGMRDWLGVRVTRSRHAVEPVLAHGQPVVPAARTIVDLAPKLTQRALTGLLYDVTRTRVTTAEEVLGTAEAIGGGLPGLRSLRQVLASFDPVFEAMVEARVGAALADAGLVLTPQLEVRDGPFLIARLDLADEEVQLGIEVDGFRYHGSRQAQARDRARDRHLRPLGWTICRFDATDALDRLEVVVHDVLAIRARLLREQHRAG